MSRGSIYPAHESRGYRALTTVVGRRASIVDVWNKGPRRGDHAHRGDIKLYYIPLNPSNLPHISPRPPPPHSLHCPARRSAPTPPLSRRSAPQRRDDQGPPCRRHHRVPRRVTLRRVRLCDLPCTGSPSRSPVLSRVFFRFFSMLSSGLNKTEICLHI